MKVNIRPMKFHDITQSQQLNQKSLAENYDRNFWDAKFYAGKTHSFVAIWAGLVVGYIFCDQQTIISFATDEKFRNKGIGKQLLYHCLSTYTTPIHLHVRVTNEVALNLYKSVGFIKQEKLIEYYNDPVEDGYLLIWGPTDRKYYSQSHLKIK